MAPENARSWQFMAPEIVISWQYMAPETEGYWRSHNGYQIAEEILNQMNPVIKHILLTFNIS
jgi:hypothetical protein